jgi:hypothetical protein
VMGAFLLTFIEAILTLLMIRLVFRLMTWPLRRKSRLAALDLPSATGGAALGSVARDAN